MKEPGNEKILMAAAPQLPGLTFRRFRGAPDYACMADLIAACKVVDGVERSTAVEDVALTYRHLENCDPDRDILFAELDGRVIAYGRVFWDQELDGRRIYNIFGFLHPQWRHAGIGTAMWQFAEDRVQTLAADLPEGTPCFMQSAPLETEKDLIGLLEDRGYQPVRYETHMLRDLSEPFPEVPMPQGLEVRPVRPEDIWPIFHASNEAFRDHWGARDETEEQHKAFMEGPLFHPELWKVAWDGDQMASVVHNFIDEKENQEYRRQRGYTEGICTRRAWRHKGLARSLLVQSMRMFKDLGMTETALGVDSENLSGALRLYESVGYRKVRQQIIYRKRLE
jgi:mycothiol synthase